MKQPKISDIKQPLFYLRAAIKQNDLEGKVRLALDVAATSFYENPARPLLSGAGGGVYKIDGKEIDRVWCYMV